MSYQKIRANRNFRMTLFGLRKDAPLAITVDFRRGNNGKKQKYILFEHQHTFTPTQTVVDRNILHNTWQSIASSPNAHFHVVIAYRPNNSAITPYIMFTAPYFASASPLIQQLAKAYNNPDMSDFAVKLSDGTTIHVSKFILQLHSEVFTAMLNHDMKETQTSTLEIKDVEPSLMKSMFRYLYTGQMRDLELIDLEMYKLADRYAIGVVQNLCMKSICKKLTPKTVLNTLEFVDKYTQHPEFRNCVFKYAKDNIEHLHQLCTWNDFKSTNPEIVQELEA